MVKKTSNFKIFYSKFSRLTSVYQLSLFNQIKIKFVCFIFLVFDDDLTSNQTTTDNNHQPTKTIIIIIIYCFSVRVDVRGLVKSFDVEIRELSTGINWPDSKSDLYQNFVLYICWK